MRILKLEIYEEPVKVEPASTSFNIMNQAMIKFDFDVLQVLQDEKLRQAKRQLEEYEKRTRQMQERATAYIKPEQAQTAYEQMRQPQDYYGKKIAQAYTTAYNRGLVSSIEMVEAINNVAMHHYSNRDFDIMKQVKEAKLQLEIQAMYNSQALGLAPSLT